MGSLIKLRNIVEFETIFPNEKRLSPEEYLKGASQEYILKAAALFLRAKPGSSRFNNNKELLGLIFGRENNALANDVYKIIKAHETPANKLKIINTYSSLKLFELFYAKSAEPATQTPPEFEINFFKAYLTLNSEWIQRQEKAFSSTRTLDSNLQIPMMIFCMLYPLSDKENYDPYQLWITQLLKAIYLFQFLENNQKTQALLQAFLKYFRCTTWQEYLKKLLPLTTTAIHNEREAPSDFTVTPDENFEENCQFLEKLAVETSTELKDFDFLAIRTKPFYKVSNGVYRIIFNLFVIEKIFKGVYFLLRVVNDRLPKEDKIKEIRSFYGNEFSEKILLYRILENIYLKNCIKFSGAQLSNLMDGEPDYYIRKGKHILLFESKDFLIQAEKKESFDYKTYEAEFKRVLYYEDLPNGKQKQKAILQLINNIRRLLKKEFQADKSYHYKDIFIYPILITHDHQYDTAGFNYLLNYWFEDEVSGLEQEGLFIHHIKPLTIINIDTLIFHQVVLAETFPLHKILQLYIEKSKIKPKTRFSSFEERKQTFLSTFVPFSTFINDHFDSKELRKLPPIIEIVAPVLFIEEWDENSRSKE